MKILQIVSAHELPRAQDGIIELFSDGTTQETIGRATETNTIITPSFSRLDRMVGRKHALITESPGTNNVVIRDQGSQNGIRVNEGRIPPNGEETLKPGDEFSLGLITFRYDIVPRQQPTSDQTELIT